MLWTRGELVRDDELAVSVLDRTFEHGVGLFETFRTWNGHPTLLFRHLERLQNSARILGLTLDPEQLPSSRDVKELIDANREVVPSGHDARLRITLSGGSEATPSHSLLWMTAGPLPPPHRKPGIVISTSFQVAADDPLARHKTLSYWRRRIAHAEAIATGSDEILCLTHHDTICEASRSNVFLVQGNRLLTPSLDGPLLPGVMRRVVLEKAAEACLEIDQIPLRVEHIKSADEAFLTNSLRGVVPIALLLGAELRAPGDLTRQVWARVSAWLESAGVG
jgi:branched-subunit amino acid aminotransferase/4-amino-4-deoxychorismate lyase